MRFGYRIAMIDALTRSEACAKQIVHFFEFWQNLPPTGLDPILPCFSS